MLSIESTAHWLRPINLLAKRAGEQSAGNLHAPFDVAGDGNQLTVRLVRHSQRKRGATDRSNLRSQAPFLDPTRSNKNKEGAAESVVLLCRVLPQVETHLASRPRAFGADDLLDAAAAAWSALRLHNAEVLPVCTPERDGKDLSVAIWY
jgi:hypothetical protein